MKKINIEYFFLCSNINFKKIIKKIYKYNYIFNRKNIIKYRLFS